VRYGVLQKLPKTSTEIIYETGQLRRSKSILDEGKKCRLLLNKQYNDESLGQTPGKKENGANGLGKRETLFHIKECLFKTIF
jgi:hypothetical protein